MVRPASDWDELIARTTTIIQSDGALRRERAVAYGNRGVARHNKGEATPALTDFAAAIGIDPDYARAYFARGTAHLHAGDLDEAIADLSEAIERAPRYAPAFHSRALAWQRKGRAEAAVVDFTDAIRLEPLDAASYVGRGGATSSAPSPTSARRSASIRTMPTPGPSAAICMRCAGGVIRRSRTGARRCGCGRPWPTIAAGA